MNVRPSAWSAYRTPLVASLIVHSFLAIGMIRSATPRVTRQVPTVIDFALLDAPSSPPPVASAEPEVAKPPEAVKPRAPRPTLKSSTPVTDTTVAVPASDVETPPSTAPPVFRFDMKGTTEGSASGSSGGTSAGGTAGGTGTSGGGQGVPAYKLHSMPRETGDCRGAYPERAKALGIEGVVRLNVEIKADGSVGVVRVEKSLGYGLDEVAVRALEKCKFEPGKVDNIPVATSITYHYRFTLSN